jgi:two-component system nitrate/nitrite sensor histidine kinase NarX
VLSSNDIVILKNYDQDDNEKPGGYTIFGMPMITSAESITGVLLVGRNRNLELTQRQRGLIRSLASQAALVLNNMEMLAELEYRTLIDERERLSREIHDGLAQTLGFLKLKIAQMGNYLEYGEYDQLEKAIPVCYETVSEAYIDARQAIDGLRVPSNESGIAGWLQKMVTDFVENTGLVIDLIIKENDLELPPEVNAQLMRVVQEALNNIRKHSQANQINISCGKYQDDLILEIRDNGIGFDSSDIQVPTTHGLRSMRERTELIGGEIQVIGKNNNGTIVRIRMPLKIRESVS